METERKISQKQHDKSRRLFIILSGVLMILSVFISLSIGSVELSVSDIFNSLFGRNNSMAENILFNIRMPRVLSACLAGMVLSVSGAVMQSLLRNPLGSPFTLGISHAAAFGAALSIILFESLSRNYSFLNGANIFSSGIISISAFIFSLISVSIILLISRIKGASPEIMILSGIAVGSLFTAGIAAIQYFATEVQLASIVFWTFGDFGRAGWKEFYILLFFSVPVIIYFLVKRWTFLSLDSGDEIATSLGVNVNRTRVVGMLLASLVTSVAISFFGIIAFVGLVVPHIVRRIIGSNERFVIPASLLFGGFFLLLADTFSRTIISPMVLPVGILTSFLGAPVFIFLIIKRREVW